MYNLEAEQVEENRGYALLLEALGPLARILESDNVVEVYCNSNCPNIWIEYLGKGRVKSDIVLSNTERLQIIKIVASFCKTVVSKENPIISAELPRYGYRFEASIPEITLMASFNIRKPALVVFTLDSYVKNGIMTEKQKKIIELAVQKKYNILVGGGTGSGKTTLCNAILREVAKTGDRLVIIEDTRELQCSAEDYEALRTSYYINATQLLRTTMRRRPDRIVVGEVRDGAAYDLLKAWNTGHPGGVSTTHANSALESLHRLESLALEAVTSVSSDLMCELIGSTVNIVVFISRAVENVDGKQVKTRKVKEVVCCRGYDKTAKEFILESDEDKVLQILDSVVE